MRSPQPVPVKKIYLSSYEMFRKVKENALTVRISRKLLFAILFSFAAQGATAHGCETTDQTTEDKSH